MPSTDSNPTPADSAAAGAPQRSLRSRRIAAAATACVSIAAALASVAVSSGATRLVRARAAAQATPRLVADGLNQPREVTVAPNGSLIVALGGDGVAPPSCTNGNQPSCLDHSGAVDEISPSGQVTRLLSGLPSVGSGAEEAQGPAEARLIGGHVYLVDQQVIINSRGQSPYGPGGALLDDLVRFTGTTPQVLARFGLYEAAHNPDHGAGTNFALHLESVIDSDSYSFVAYRGGFVVADAGANDVLFVSRTGRISLLAVLPTIREIAPPGSFDKRQTKTIVAQAESVPDSVVVGPDGALYVAELGGVPYGVGKSSIFRLVPGHRPTVYATGFTSIGAIAFDHAGHLLVLEIDQRGLGDPGLSGKGAEAPGAIIELGRDGSRTMIASTGLVFPDGIAVGPGGVIYVTNYGVNDADQGTDHAGGELVAITPPGG